MKVRLYAILRDVSRTDELTVPFREGDSADDLLRRLSEEYPELRGYLPEVAVVEGDEYVGRGERLKGNLDISLLPPVSGGSGTPCLTKNPIPVEQLIESLSNPEAGAIVTFLGTVRREEDSKPIEYLEYEAHEVLAELECQKIVEEARERWPLLQVEVRHRLGRVPVGEVSLFIGVSAPHREEAYRASRHILEAVKYRVPIWKKELFADGTHSWVESEAALK